MEIIPESLLGDAGGEEPGLAEFEVAQTAGGFENMSQNGWFNGRVLGLYRHLCSHFCNKRTQIQKCPLEKYTFITLFFRYLYPKTLVVNRKPMTITLLPYVLVLRSFLNPFLIRVNHLNQLNHSSRHFLKLKLFRPFRAALLYAEGGN